MRCLVALAALSLACAGCGGRPHEPEQPAATIFAAASLVTALDGIVADYESAHHADITVSYASSAMLAQQIISGAEADIFISASLAWADEVAGTHSVRRREDALGNSLVLITPVSNPAGIDGVDDLADAAVTRIAIGEPESVPAGQYAREALTALGLWDVLHAKLVYTLDVRQALLYAERGEAEAAIVYATDAAGSNRIKVIARLDDALAAPVRYGLLLLDADRENGAAADFFDYLLSTEAEPRFEAAGFERLPLSDGVS